MRRVGSYLVLFGCFFLGYQALVFGLFLLRAGAWPNFFRVHNFIPEVVETLSYRPPLQELARLVPDQPVYMYAWVFEKTNTTQWLFIFTLWNLLISVLLSLLLAANVCLLRALKARGGPLKGSACLGGAGAVMGAGISAAACCGSASSSLLLTALGLGSSAITAIEWFAGPLEWIGLGLLTGSTVYFYREVRRERKGV